MGLTSSLRPYAKMAARALGAEVCTQAPIGGLPRIPHPGSFTVGAAGVQQETAFTIINSLVALVVRQYRVPLPPLQVIVTKLDGRAAEIQAGGAIVRLLVDELHGYDSFQLVSIVAHEMAHYVLHGASVSLPETSENERLTDTVAVLAGFGPVMLRGYEQKHSWKVGSTQYTRTRRLGYLTVEEIGQLAVQRSRLTSDPPVRRVPVVAGGRLSCWGCYNHVALPKTVARMRVRCHACGAAQFVTILSSDASPLNKLSLTWCRLHDWIRGLPE